MITTTRTRWARWGVDALGAASVLAVLVAASFIAAPAASAAPLPHWTMISQAAPTYFHPGDGSDFYEVVAINDGGAATSGEVTISDTLPAGLQATQVTAKIEDETTVARAGGGTYMTCPTATPLSGTITCTTPKGAPVGMTVMMKIDVEVPAGATGTLNNEVTISGGGAQPATATNSTPVTPPAETAPYGGSLTAQLTDSEGGSDTQAGSQPAAFTSLLALNVSAVDPEHICGDISSCALTTHQTRDLEFPLPAGVIGNPSATPTCSQESFQLRSTSGCPASTQVGNMYLFFHLGTSTQYAPVYNIEPPSGQPAELGFSVSTLAHIPIFFHLRADGDYGLTADIANVTQFDPVRMAALSIWGVPAAEAHDQTRQSDFNCSEFGCPAGVPAKPFLTLPTSCSSPTLPLSVSGDSWQEPFSAPFPLLSSTSLPGMSGCNALHFDPKLEARPTTNVADSPSGLHVDLKVPQPESIATPAEAHLKEAVVTLPKGLTVNPSSANGLEGCSPAQIGLTSPEGALPIRTTAAPAQCPDAAKLGTVEVITPLLKERNEAGEPAGPHPLPGSVYLATPYDNPFKSLLALYITVNDPKTGTVVKLAGEVHVAPDGQLTTTVQESPQVPFEDFKLDFFGGARAPLRTPATCGRYETTSALTPWSAPESGPPAERSDSYLISSGPNGHPCANTEAAEPNSPSFEAGTEAPIAGSYSPFSLHLHREDGSQNFSALNVNLPPGLVGKLAGVGECSDSALATAATKSGAAEQASPSCPASSKLGTATVGAGAGPSPYYVTGQAYLSGPYKGAPLSVAIVTPAVAGPFDLGTVVVRSALHIDPETAQVSVTSDPIPTQLQGIQLDVRSIDLKLDRNQFTLNPTNCERSAISGEEVSSLNQIAPLSNPFQVGACNALKFKPKLSLSLKGGVKRNRNPALKATLTMPKGGANIARAQVTLPHSEFLDQAHIGTVCTRVQFAAGAGNGEQCPAASIYGHARAITPLLDQPVEGPVYLRSSSHKLPDLVAALGGQISVDLAGKVDTGKGGGIRNTFEVVPDAPVSKFVLSMKGGDKGLLVNSENICKKPQKALAHFVAQNGKVDNFSPVIANSCGGKGKKKSKKGSHGKGKHHAHRVGTSHR